MTNLQRMKAERAELKRQLEQLSAAHPNGELPEAEQQQWNKLHAEWRGVQAGIDRQSELNEVEHRMQGTPLAGGDNRWQELMSGYSLARACLYHDPSVDSGREREVSQEVQRRTGRKPPRGILAPHDIFSVRQVEARAGQVVGDPALGGYLNPDRFRPDLYTDRLRPASALARLGVTWLTDLQGQQVIPKLVQSSTVQFVDENEEPDESEAKWGTVTLSPHTAAAQMRYSRRTLLNATPSIDALLRDDIAKQVAGAIDRVGISGQASAKEPVGLLNIAGLNTISLGTNGAMPTVEQLIDLTAAPDIADAMVGGPAWLTNGKVVAAVSKLKDGGGTYMFLNSLPGSLLGYPVVRTSTVPSDRTKGTGTALSCVIFGAWASVLVGLWSGLDILSDPYTAGASGQVRLYAFQDLDVGVRHIESFAAFTDVKTA